ncbi:hypothetical protein ACHAPU_009326 [Fusarium lateritium]
MVVIQHDIVPDGDMELILKDHSTQEMTPNVYLSYTIENGATEIDVRDYVDYPQVSSGLPSLEVSDEDYEDLVEIRMRVSSHHMMLASPVLKRMIKGPWKESSTDHESNSVRKVTTTGWDAHALVVVLNIIHGQNQNVPQEISFEFFTNVAAIVNYYDCAMAVQLAAELWCRNMYSPPEYYGKSAIMWLFISRLFDWPSVASDMARLIFFHSKGLELVETNDLPIGPLLYKLDLKRQEFILNILFEFEDLITGLKYQDTSKPRFEELGVLISYQGAMEICDPPLTFESAPYPGYSVESALRLMKSLSKPELCKDDPFWGKRAYYGRHAPCELYSAMVGIQKATWDVTIADFES